MYDFGMWFRNPTIPLSLLLFISSTALAQDGTVTIYSNSALADLRPCASTCMNETSIAEWLRCRTPLMNGCFCRRGLTSIGRASLFDCAKAGCNGDYEVDGMGLTSVYTSYCNVYLAQLQTTSSPASNTARTTNGSGGDGTTLQTSRQTSTDTMQTNTPEETSSPSSRGLSLGGIIGIVVAVFVVAIVAIGGIWLRRRRGVWVPDNIWSFKFKRQIPVLPRGRANDAFKESEIEAASSRRLTEGSPVQRFELGHTARPPELE
ncbi:hypothetical protein TWF718_001045 [Orbilia javanica]|uniref:Extracellular membrane protein CFEM domain-containing protein n=1 Tax=Orbilia javanica TaxID=47235 RepID=A0AAN8N0Q1_9PEZI